MYYTGVVAPATSSSIRRGSTALFINIPEEDRSPAQREIAKLQERWNAVRHLSADEVAAASSDDIEDDLKAAHIRFLERYHKDMANMEIIASKLVTMLDPPKISKKTKSQRKRDKWAIVSAREQFRAAAKK